MGKRLKPEETLHRAVVTWLRLQYPKLLFFHVPNANSGPVQWRVKLKQLGVATGCPDLVFVLPGGRTGFVELKSPGSYPSDAQLAFGSAARGSGARWACCRSLEAVQVLMHLWVPLGAGKRT